MPRQTDLGSYTSLHIHSFIHLSYRSGHYCDTPIDLGGGGGGGGGGGDTC